ncbi:MAG: UvrD-helicase domain-containing protein, partial [Bacillota bacterium]|nr:UvrD-helicase domain-containing protein [Bacillota bacterium]
MESMSWTTEQQEAISDIGQNLLVSAAAGSGKTAVLVERIIQLVVKKGVNIDEMLIVSFTEAAATQMKNKIYKALAEAGLDDQIERMSRASICTLSSFAFSVVKNYYHLIGADPSCKICDDIKARLLQQEALDDMYEQLFECKDSDFLYFLDR